MWIDSTLYEAFHLVLADEPTTVEAQAAAAFQHHWAACTAQEIGASAFNEGLVNVWFGPRARETGLLSADELEGLGEEGFRVRTYTPTARARGIGTGRHLLIAADTDVGGANGVYDFLERALNVRWFAPGVTRTPRASMGIERLDYAARPAFAFREVGYHGLWRGDDGAAYRRANKFQHEFTPGPFGAHTFHALLPPARHFETHPEFYALVDGRRHAPHGHGQAAGPQICCANPATAEAVLAEIAALIEAGPNPADAELATRRNAVFAHPSGKVASVSPMDGPPPCACSLCREAEAAEGSAAGPLLLLVNRVAEGLEKAYPGEGYRVHTLARQHTRRPPENLRPRGNVIVQVCGFECDFSRPLNDPVSPVNAAFLRDLEGWAGMSGALYVWNHAANLSMPLYAHPNLRVVQPNLQLFTQFFPAGVYEQAWMEPGAELAEFAALRSYVLSRALWDPDVPGEVLYGEFINGYYGPAAPALRAYIELISDKVREDGVYLHCMQDNYWFDYDLVVEAQNLFEEALAKRLNDAQRRCVEEARLPVHLAALTCPPRARFDGGALILERPPAMTLEDFLKHLRETGGAPEDGPSYDLEAAVRRACGGDTPPREQRHPLVVLEDARHLVWVAPSLGGAVVRWRDKALGTEMLRGYEFPTLPGSIREWRVEPDGTAQPAVEAWEAVEQTATRLVLRASTDDGLTLTRTIALDGEELALMLEVRNRADEPRAPRVTLRPEFHSQGMHAPDLWVEGADGWALVAAPPNPLATPWRIQHVPVNGTQSWAFHAPAANLSVVNRLDADALSSLRFVANWEHRAQQASLELVLDPVPLAPGAARTLHAAYRVMAGPPSPGPAGV